MEFTKPLFMRIRSLSKESLETIINTMWPETPTFDDEADITMARTKAKRFFQSYRYNLNNELIRHTDIIIDQYNKYKWVLNFH